MYLLVAAVGKLKNLKPKCDVFGLILPCSGSRFLLASLLFSPTEANKQCSLFSAVALFLFLYPKQ